MLDVSVKDREMNIKEEKHLVLFIIAAILHTSSLLPIYI